MARGARITAQKFTMAPGGVAGGGERHGGRVAVDEPQRHAGGERELVGDVNADVPRLADAQPVDRLRRDAGAAPELHVGQAGALEHREQRLGRQADGLELVDG